MNNPKHAPYPWYISQVSEDSLLIEYITTGSEFHSSASEQISVHAHQNILALREAIVANLTTKIVDVIISYSSILVIFNKHSALNDLLEDELALLCQHLPLPLPLSSATTNIVHIEVYYSKESGWDLERVAKHCQMSISEVIDLHSQPTYQVFANGFTPGFCYLGVVNKQLRLPRLSTPRLKVPKGGVAIAEQQSAVYPQASPGGWHIIGQTAQPMLRYEQDVQPLLQVGDRVKFVAISKQAFIAAAGKISYE